MKKPAEIIAIGEGLLLIGILAIAGAVASAEQLYPAEPVQKAADARPVAEADKTNPARPYVEAIAKADDPSTAIEAYSKGVSAYPESTEVRETYLRRMISFGMADVSFRQAQVLLARDPDNGLARAVVAYTHANRGQMDEALGKIHEAAQQSPDDPFVQRTAGELVAWYDWQNNKSPLAEELRDLAGDIRGMVAGRLAFSQGYSRARIALNDAVQGAPAGKGSIFADPGYADRAKDDTGEVHYDADINVTGWQRYYPYDLYTYNYYSFYEPSYYPSYYPRYGILVRQRRHKRHRPPTVSDRHRSAIRRHATSRHPGDRRVRTSRPPFGHVRIFTRLGANRRSVTAPRRKRDTPRPGRRRTAVGRRSSKRNPGRARTGVNSSGRSTRRAGRAGSGATQPGRGAGRTGGRRGGRGGGRGGRR